MLPVKLILQLVRISVVLRIKHNLSLPLVSRCSVAKRVDAGPPCIAVTIIVAIPESLLATNIDRTGNVSAVRNGGVASDGNVPRGGLEVAAREGRIGSRRDRVGKPYSVVALVTPALECVVFLVEIKLICCLVDGGRSTLLTAVVMLFDLAIFAGYWITEFTLRLNHTASSLVPPHGTQLAAIGGSLNALMFWDSVPSMPVNLC